MIDDSNRSHGFSEDFDRRLLNFNYKMVGLLAGIFFRPMATAAEPFFRKNLGVRYFTWTSAALGAFLWVAAGIIAVNFGSFGPELAYLLHAPRLAAWLSEHQSPGPVSGFLCMAFLILAVINIVGGRQRLAGGVNWHSMSRGESWWGVESIALDACISVVVGVSLFVLAPLPGLLFLVSRGISGYLAQLERQSLYARYLDEMDARIEAQHLEIALRDATPPMTNEGIYGPLPKRFKGEHRANVARIVARTPFVAAAAPGRTQAPVPIVTAANRLPEPAQAENFTGENPAIPTTVTAPARPGVAAVVPSNQVASGEFSPEVLCLLSKTWHHDRIKDIQEGRAKGTKSDENIIFAALAMNYEVRTYGLGAPPRAQTKIGSRDNNGNMFAPEVLHLFQKTFDAATVERLVKARATAPQTLPATLELVRQALKIGYARDGLAEF